MTKLAFSLAMTLSIVIVSDALFCDVAPCIAKVVDNSAAEGNILLDRHFRPAKATYYGEILQTWKHDGVVRSVAFSPDGTCVLTGADDRTAVLRNVATGEILQTWTHGDLICSLAFSPDGQRVLTGSQDRTAVLRDATTGETLQTWKHDGSVHSVAFSPNARFVVTGSSDCTSVLRDANTGENLHSWRYEAGVNVVAISPDSRRVLIGLWDGTVVMQDVATGETLRTWKHDRVVCSVAFSPDGRRVLTAADDHTATLRDAAKGETLRIWMHKGGVWSVAFSPDGRRVLTGSRDCTIVLHDAITGETVHVWKQEDSVRSVAFSPDGQRILIGSDDNLAILRDASFGMPPISPTAMTVPSVNISRDPELERLKGDVIRRQRELSERKRIDAERRQLEETKRQLEGQLAELQAKEAEGVGGGPDDLPARLSSCPVARNDPHRYLLAVGIGLYSSLPAVPYAAQAASMFSDAAGRLLGVPESNRIVLTNGDATGTRLKGALRRLVTRLGPQDSILVYYAGHGAPSRDGTSSYLLPHDGDEATYDDVDMRLEQLYQTLAASPARHITVVLDACFAGRSGPQALLFKGVAPLTIVSKSVLPNPQRFTVLTAGQGDQFANAYTKKSERLFTYWVVDALIAGKRGGQDVIEHARRHVEAESRQLGPTYVQIPGLQGIDSPL